MSLRIVQHGPTRLGLYQFLVANRSFGGAQIGYFEEEHSFILGRIGFSSLSLQADKSAIEFGVVSGLLLRQAESKGLDIKRLRFFKVFKIEFNADKLRSHLFVHSFSLDENRG